MPKEKSKSMYLPNLVCAMFPLPKVKEAPEKTMEEIKKKKWEKSRGQFCTLDFHNYSTDWRNSVLIISKRLQWLWHILREPDCERTDTHIDQMEKHFGTRIYLHLCPRILSPIQVGIKDPLIRFILSNCIPYIYILTSCNFRTQVLYLYDLLSKSAIVVFVSFLFLHRVWLPRI